MTERVELLHFESPSSGAARQVVGYATFALHDRGLTFSDMKVTRNAGSGRVYIELPTAPVFSNGQCIRDADGRWITRSLVQFISRMEQDAFFVAARAELFAHHPYIFDHLPPDMPIPAAVIYEGTHP